MHFQRMIMKSQPTFVHKYRNTLRIWNNFRPSYPQRARTRGIVFVISSLYIVFYSLLGSRSAPFNSEIESQQIEYPSSDAILPEYVLQHAHTSNQPVYVFYPTWATGQLNNQFIALLNALCIAHKLNATLVSPPVRYGLESMKDWSARQPFFKRMIQGVLGVQREKEWLVGDYFDIDLLNELQPVVQADAFLYGSEGGATLQNFPGVLVRGGEAREYYELLDKQVTITGRTISEEEPPDPRPVSSRKDVDCEFEIEPFFRGVGFRAGLNANFIFLPRIFRTHELNCTESYPFWREARRYIQPHPTIRTAVEEKRREWNSYAALHLRFMPYDKKHPLTPGAFVDMILEEHSAVLAQASYLYVAYSGTCNISAGIVSELKSRPGINVITAEAYDSNVGTDISDRKYTLPLLDMWTCVKSDYFIGRTASSLSTNVVYWREAMNENTNSVFYSLEDVSSRESGSG